MAVLPKRFARFGLTLHPDKTRLIDFRRPPSGGGGSQKGRSFDFLGFTHHWGQSRLGNWVVRQKTAKSRFKRAVTTTAQWCRRHRHLPVKEQWVSLVLKLNGHYVDAQRMKMRPGPPVAKKLMPQFEADTAAVVAKLQEIAVDRVDPGQQQQASVPPLPN